LTAPVAAKHTLQQRALERGEEKKKTHHGQRKNMGAPWSIDFSWTTRWMSRFFFIHRETN
ncbi:hypothetical protein AMECASPLE_026770, partial [Ameca splendens]